MKVTRRGRVVGFDDVPFEMDMSSLQHSIARRVLTETQAPTHMWVPIGERIKMVARHCEMSDDLALKIARDVLAEYSIDPDAEATPIERRRYTSERYDETVHEPVVYYIRLGSLVKIGTTTSLRTRIASFHPEELLAVEVGGYGLESRRHDQFRAWRRTGEWFEYSDELRRHVESLPRIAGAYMRRRRPA